MLLLIMSICNKNNCAIVAFMYRAFFSVDTLSFEDRKPDRFAEIISENMREIEKDLKDLLGTYSNLRVQLTGIVLICCNYATGLVSTRVYSINEHTIGRLFD